MIGYFNFLSLRKTPGYREYYRAALRTLEKDPNGEIAFVAITSPDLAWDHQVTQFPSASLLMWNETLVKNASILGQLLFIAHYTHIIERKIQRSISPVFSGQQRMAGGKLGQLD